MVGFAVGVGSCNQVLFTDVVENLPRFAMLKAIGYSNGFLFRVVAQEAGWLSLLGLGPGLLASLTGSFYIERLTNVMFRLTLPPAPP